MKPERSRRRVVTGLYHRVPYWNLPRGSLAPLAARFPDWEFRETASEEELHRELPAAEVYFGWWLPEDLVRSASGLRWVHTTVVGIRRFLTPAFRESPAVFTNGRGINAVAMAEHVTAVLLARTRGLAASEHLMAERRWDPEAVERMARGLRELAGSTILLVGYGTVGKEIARRALAFEMRVHAIRRGVTGGGSTEDGVLVRSREALLDSLGEADYVVSSLPHTAETENFFDDEAFGRMKPSAYFVNVGRGAVVVEEALLRAVRENRIDGASLDVVAHEPLDAGDPLYREPRIRLTPHTSGLTPRYWERALVQFEENLVHYERGEKLANRVDKEAGY